MFFSRNKDALRHFHSIWGDFPPFFHHFPQKSLCSVWCPIWGDAWLAPRDRSITHGDRDVAARSALWLDFDESGGWCEVEPDTKTKDFPAMSPGFLSDLSRNWKVAAIRCQRQAPSASSAWPPLPCCGRSIPPTKPWCRAFSRSPRSKRRLQWELNFSITPWWMGVDWEVWLVWLRVGLK